MSHPMNPTADPVAQLEQFEQAFSREGWYAGPWPITTDQAAAILSGPGEYAIDAAQLADLVERRLLTGPAREEDGALEWSAEDVYRATALLEVRQAWRPTPSRHDAKKHPTRLILEQSRAEGTLAEVAHAGPVRFDLRHLLTLLTRSDIPEARTKIAALLEAVLEVDHGVTL